MKKAKKTALCGMLIALSVVLMATTTIVPIAMYIMPILTGVIVILVLRAVGVKYALGVYIATSVLCLILITDKEAALTYALIFGYYPIIKQKFDRLPRVLAWVIKLLLCTAILGVCFLVIHFLMLGGGDIKTSFVTFFGGGDGKTLMAWAVVGLSVFTFVLFDLLIDRLLILYYIKWQKRVERWMKP